VLFGVELTDRSAQEHADPIAAYYYADVGRYQRSLSEEEKEKVVTSMLEVKDKIKSYLLTFPEVQEFFRERVKYLHSRPGGSVAKLSEQANPKIRGHNQALTQMILKAGEAGEWERCDLKYDLYVEAYHETRLHDSFADKLIGELREHETTLVCSALKMVQYIVNKKGKIYNTDKKDLVQAGNEELLKAVRRYKPEKGGFAHFAYKSIEGGISNHISGSTRLVALPPLKTANAHHVRQASRQIQDEERPTLKRLAEECAKMGHAMTEKDVEEAILHLSSNPASLDAPVTSGDSGNSARTLGEVLSDGSVSTEVSVNTYLSGDKSAAVLLNELPALEAAVLYFRFLDPDYVPKREGSSERPYQEICNQFRLWRMDPRVYPTKSREYIRMIERRGMNRLKMNSKYFWRRFYDEQLITYLTLWEWSVLWEQTIAPKCEGHSPIGWYTTACTIGRTTKYVIDTRRRAMAKIRKHHPELVEWLTHH
jgi:RNA polymerase sigma factor (sigma-70 family)